MPETGEDLIVFENVCKSFGSLHVLKGVSLAVKRGETLVIIGQSGVGKSVSLRLMIGLLYPDSGKCLYMGREIPQMNDVQLDEMRRHFAMLFQSGALFDSMTVGENVTFGLRANGMTDEDEMTRIMEDKLRAVGLGKKKFPEIPAKLPSQLSGGQKKRVALARAIAVEPEIVLYDEPTTGLDPIMSDAIADLIISTCEDLKHKNVTSIVVTHDMHVALKTADRILMFHGGEIVGEGDPDYYRNIRETDDDSKLTEKEKMIRQFVRGQAVGPIQAVL